MKTVKFILSVCLLSFTTILSGQTYKIKKEVLLKDKVPVARVTGELNWVRGADMALETLEGEVFCEIVTRNFKPSYPMFDEVRWTILNFPEFNKTFTLARNTDWGSKISVVRNEVVGQGLQISEKGINPENLEGLYEKDISLRLNEDTLAIIEEIAFMRESLEDNSIERDRSRPHALVPLVSKNPAEKVSLVTQDVEGLGMIYSGAKPLVVGKVVHETNNPYSVVYEPTKDLVVIYKKLKNPVVRDGKELEFFPAGEIDFTKRDIALFLFETGEVPALAKYNREMPRQEVIGKAVKYMIIRGFL